MRRALPSPVDVPSHGRLRAMWSVAAAAWLACACGAPPQKSAPKETVVWKNLGSWSGRGNTQTESFVVLTGSLRMHWETKNEASGGGGRFRLTLLSAVSGRALQDSVDEMGEGEGTVYLADDPHVFYAIVDSDKVDWSFSVDEASYRVEGRSPAAPR